MRIESGEHTTASAACAAVTTLRAMFAARGYDAVSLDALDYWHARDSPLSNALDEAPAAMAMTTTTTTTKAQDSERASAEERAPPLFCSSTTMYDANDDDDVARFVADELRIKRHWIDVGPLSRAATLRRVRVAAYNRAAREFVVALVGDAHATARAVLRTERSMRVAHIAALASAADALHAAFVRALFASSSRASSLSTSTIDVNTASSSVSATTSLSTIALRLVVVVWRAPSTTNAVVASDVRRAFADHWSSMRVEFFAREELMYVVIEHRLQPRRWRRVAAAPHESDPTRLPEMFVDDAVARFFAWPVGAVVEIERADGEREWRCVVARDDRSTFRAAVRRAPRVAATAGAQKTTTATKANGVKESARKRGVVAARVRERSPSAHVSARPRGRPPNARSTVLESFDEAPPSLVFAHTVGVNGDNINDNDELLPVL